MTTKPDTIISGTAAPGAVEAGPESDRLDAPRERAAGIVAELADRLADASWVEKSANTPGNADAYPGTNVTPSVWGGANLGEGHAGMAVFYGELSAVSTEHRATVHTYLRAAAGHLKPHPEEALFLGATAVAFAAWAARRAPEDYAGLLRSLDARISSSVLSRLARENERLNAGIPGADVREWDAISGVTGIGRYLLRRGPVHREPLASTLSYLVRLTRPVHAHGHTVPGWWSPKNLGLYDDPLYSRGHFNLGLAHGIPGPLTLMALSWQADVRVPGQEEAMEAIVDELLRWRLPEGLWPSAIGFEQFLAGPDATGDLSRAVCGWCYGTPGVARALHLAGTALGRADWQHTAVRALDVALELRHTEMTDSSLCHGWAGLLQTTWRMAREGGDASLARRVPELARHLMDTYDPELPFGFFYRRRISRPGMKLAPHRAGFLEGAAGAALALHTYATDQEPAGGWDSALLLS